MSDLFVSRFRGRTADGRLIADLEATGEVPTFASDLHDRGMEQLARLTSRLWSK